MFLRHGTLFVGCFLWIAGGLQVGSALAEDIQVNTFTTGRQEAPSVAMDADGNFVVTWNGYGPNDFEIIGVHGQRFASDGSPVGDQFQVTGPQTVLFTSSDVSLDADGDFVVVWSSRYPLGSGDEDYGIQGRRFASDGTPLDGGFHVNTYTTSSQVNPVVASAADGSFIVVWSSPGSFGTDNGSSVQGQRYDPDGLPVDGEFQINTTTTYGQGSAEIAMQSNGDFVVVWQSRISAGTDTNFDSIQGQRFAADGSPLGGEFQVNTFTTSYQRRPAVAVQETGEFVVVWQSSGSFGPDTNLESIQGQRYAADGSPVGGEFQVNTYSTSRQVHPSVAVDEDGNFIVVWESRGSFGTDSSGSSAQGQRFAGDGSRIGEEFQINSYTNSEQDTVSVVMTESGDSVIVWESIGSSGTDGNSNSIQMSLFLQSIFADGFESGDTAAWGARR